MVEMGGRDIDDLKKVGCKLKIVPCSVEKLMILNHLIQNLCEDGKMQ